MNPDHDVLAGAARRAETWAQGEGPDGAEAVLSVLEADQLVAAKERARFGERRLSRGVRALLWGLRLYVVFMMALVAIQVLNAVQGKH